MVLNFIVFMVIGNTENPDPWGNGIGFGSGTATLSVALKFMSLAVPTVGALLMCQIFLLLPCLVSVVLYLFLVRLLVICRLARSLARHLAFLRSCAHQLFFTLLPFFLILIGSRSRILVM